jgi:hypothetical protein
MHDELFKQPAVVARYRAGPYAEARERFLKQARAEGYSFSTLERIAWVLLAVAEAVHPHGGSVSSTRLKSLLFRHILLSKGRPPSEIQPACFFASEKTGCGAWAHCYMKLVGRFGLLGN